MKLQLSPRDIKIENEGRKIIGTNYWHSDRACNGLPFVSVVRGAVRLLVPFGPNPFLAAVRGFRTCCHPIISKGPWPAGERDEAFEIMFDDREGSPYAIHLGMDSVDGYLTPEVLGESFSLTVWAENRYGESECIWSMPGILRDVPFLPWLKPNETDLGNPIKCTTLYVNFRSLCEGEYESDSLVDATRYPISLPPPIDTSTRHYLRIESWESQPVEVVGSLTESTQTIFVVNRDPMDGFCFVCDYAFVDRNEATAYFIREIECGFIKLRHDFGTTLTSGFLTAAFLKWAIQEIKVTDISSWTLSKLGSEQTGAPGENQPVVDEVDLI
jgi:hypothetical protein